MAIREMDMLLMAVALYYSLVDQSPIDTVDRLLHRVHLPKNKSNKNVQNVTRWSTYTEEVWRGRMQRLWLYNLSTKQLIPVVQFYRFLMLNLDQIHNCPMISMFPVLYPIWNTPSATILQINAILHHTSLEDISFELTYPHFLLNIVQSHP